MEQTVIIWPSDAMYLVYILPRSVSLNLLGRSNVRNPEYGAFCETPVPDS